MTQPLILLNCDTYGVPNGDVTGVRQVYWEAIDRAGGIPLLLPHLTSRDALERVLGCVDGVVLIGGDDISLARQSAAAGRPVAGNSNSRYMPERREQSDFNLLDLLVRRTTPTLGICLANQEFAVAHGATLLQHLPEELPGIQHVFDTPHGRASEHPVRIAPGSLLARIWGNRSEALVNSAHHQGVGGLPPTTTPQPVPVAWAPDGLIEALELPGHPFFLTVQWHPERMVGDGLQEQLFAAFVKAAQG